jgi:pilus retraction protein PilT
MKIYKYVQQLIDKKGSDLFLRVGSPAKARVYGDIVDLGKEDLSPEEIEIITEEIVTKDNLEELYHKRSYEGAFHYADHWRFRVSVFYQRNSLSLVIRKIDLKISDFETLNLPAGVLESLCSEKRGLVLLAGSTGSGKSTTIASMIEHINRRYKRHILSIEEPIEFTFDDKKSIINQREIGKDVSNYGDALKQFALHSPDVIYIGNIRDEETMRAALDAAETGVLVFSTIHTVNASQTVERILSFFPHYQQKQVLMQLSNLLKGVVSLRLIARKDKEGVIPVYESMVLSPSIARLLRENHLGDLQKYIEEGEVYGMVSFEQNLLKFVKGGKIDPQAAIDFSDRKEELKMRIQHEL